MMIHAAVLTLALAGGVAPVPSGHEFTDFFDRPKLDELKRHGELLRDIRDGQQRQNEQLIFLRGWLEGRYGHTQPAAPSPSAPQATPPVHSQIAPQPYQPPYAMPPAAPPQYQMPPAAPPVYSMPPAAPPVYPMPPAAPPQHQMPPAVPPQYQMPPAVGPQSPQVHPPIVMPPAAPPQMPLPPAAPPQITAPPPAAPSAAPPGAKSRSRFQSLPFSKHRRQQPV